MRITPADLERQLGDARAKGWDAIFARVEDAQALPRGILLAIASRETNMTDIVGDGGHGRGLFQIDDRFWKEWLTAHGAGGGGRKPPVRDAAKKAAEIVSGNLAFGRRNGVAEADLLKFALSAYNAGPGGAIADYRRGDSDLKTTGGDYGRDVLERHAAIPGKDGGQAVPAAGGPASDRLLRAGSRGNQIGVLKERLQQWFDLNAPGEWAAFKIEPGPYFGPRLDRAVRVFQERQGLLVDGVVGPQTRAALGMAAGPLPAPLRV